MPLSVYHLTYCDSLERHRYLATVEREVSVMSNLIEFKGHIVIPMDSVGGGSQVRHAVCGHQGCVHGVVGGCRWEGCASNIQLIEFSGHIVMFGGISQVGQCIRTRGGNMQPAVISMEGWRVG